jgi:NADH-quinone oxidoreductase subunit L
MTAGTLAITGVGLAPFFGFAGFYSKDAILESAFANGGEMARFAWGMGVFAALLTSFYSWRLVFLTFFGKPRWAQSEHIQHAVHDAHGHDDHAHAHADHGHAAHGDGTAGYHPHESPLSMMIPLGLLSVGAIFAGWVFAPHFVGLEGAAEFWKGAVVVDKGLIEAAEHIGAWSFAPTIVMLTGLFVAWYAYIRNPRFPAMFVEQFTVVHRFLYNKWYFDELYDLIFVRPAFWLGRQFWKLGDIGIIDRFGPNGAAWVVAQGSRAAVKLQSGYLYSYALVMLVGLVGAISWVIAR